LAVADLAFATIGGVTKANEQDLVLGLDLLEDLNDFLNSGGLDLDDLNNLLEDEKKKNDGNTLLRSPHQENRKLKKSKDAQGDSCDLVSCTYDDDCETALARTDVFCAQFVNEDGTSEQQACILEPC
jgi:hypothetical protein